MNRSLALLALLSLTGAACNSPVCGKGTVQKQAADGTLSCAPTQGFGSDIDCNADAGAVIVAGHCVSAITCGPNTTLMNGQCIGTGGMTTAHVPPACATPTAGNICINGVVRHLVDGSFLAVGEKVRVAVFDPLKFLRNPTTTPLAETPAGGTDDTYMFANIPKPSLGLIALAVGDVTGTTTQVLQLTGAGAVIGIDTIYRVDTWATPKSVVDSWTAQAGIDYDAKGALVTRYFSDTAHPATDLSFYETMPTAGVQIMQDGLVPPMGKYFGANLMTIGAATSTSAMTGTGIVPGTGDSSTPAFSGMGASIKWETHLGNSTAHVVFYEPFHACAVDGTGKCTN